MNFFVFQWPFTDAGPSAHPASQEGVRMFEEQYGNFLELDKASGRREMVFCPVNPIHCVKSFWTVDLVARAQKPREATDFEWLPPHVLVTDAMRRRLEARRFTGLSFKPARVRLYGTHGKGEALQSWWDMRVIGRGGPLASESGLRTTLMCNACEWWENEPPPSRLVVREEGWDGSDFFRVSQLPQFIFVTERVLAVAIEEEWENCQIIPADQYSEGYGRPTRRVAR